MEGSTQCEFVSECANNALDLKHTHVNKHSVHSESHLVGGNVVAELGMAFCESLLIQAAQEQVSSSCPSIVKEKTSYLEKGKLCEAFEGQNVDSMTTNTVKDLSRSATFPCSQNCIYPTTSDGMDEIPEMEMQGQGIMKSINPSCTRSISLPTPLKLVSAMKGSREKQGLPLKKLTVTWAADVYDPPTTLLSHTVKHNSQQRTRPNKKNSKNNKHKKKSLRSSNGEKQKHRKQNAGNSLLPFKASIAGSDTMKISDVHESAVEFVDFSITGQELHCGSSFLRTTLGKVHLSVAEAK